LCCSSHSRISAISMARSSTPSLIRTLHIPVLSLLIFGQCKPGERARIYSYEVSPCSAPKFSGIHRRGFPASLILGLCTRHCYWEDRKSRRLDLARRWHRVAMTRPNV
jgi:hypothetical protein